MAASTRGGRRWGRPRRSAFSANIKEQRDCSTAHCDGDGRMVAQAEHPGHLGAMPAAVAAVMQHGRQR